MYLAFEYYCNYYMLTRPPYPLPLSWRKHLCQPVDLWNLTTMPLESGLLQGLIGDKCVLILSHNEEEGLPF